MACLADSEKKLMMCLFVLTQLTNVTDRQIHTDRQTPHDGIASRGKNSSRSHRLSFQACIGVDLKLRSFDTYYTGLEADKWRS